MHISCNICVFYRVLTVVYDIQEHSFFGLSPSSHVQLKNNIPEAASASILRWQGYRNGPTLVDPLERVASCH